MVGVRDVDVGEVGEMGVVVLARDGSVASANPRACSLLNVPSADRLPERLDAIRHRLPDGGFPESGEHEAYVDAPGVGPIGIRSYAIGGDSRAGCVLLVQDARSLAARATILRQAATQRAFGFLARDWVHDLKGMLNIIRINHALMARTIQREAIGAVSDKSLEAIPREVERLDRTLDFILNPKRDTQDSVFTVASLCERLARMIAARAERQHVEVILELTGEPTEVLGFEGHLEAALLNLLVNALEAMPEQGRLVIAVEGGHRVRVRICDTGSGMHEVGDIWHPHFVNGPRGTAIGLPVTRTVVEAHGGRIECSSNAQVGTCFVIDLPAAPTERLGDGPRTHRR